MKTTYNKLVRDRIPEIIAANAGRSETRTLTMEEFIPALKEKLIEEAREVGAATATEELATELADVLEIVHALADATGLRLDDIEMVRRERAEARGAFADRILLIAT